MDQISLALTFSDVLLKPQRSAVSSRSQVSLKTKITPKLEIDFPVISINMDCVTGVDMAIGMAKYGAMSFYPRFATPEIQAAEVKQVLDAGYLTIPAVGIKPQEMDRVAALAAIGIKIITIDVAHAHQDTCLEFIKTIKSKYPDMEIIAGVVGTYEGARDLYQAGADAVRVGVGPGTICTTRIMTGSGMPQITAILEASKASKEFGLPLIPDGGTKNSGDIVKCLAAGGNAVVVGSQLAGAQQAPGQLLELNGRQYKRYNASTSKTEKENQYQKNSTDKTSDYTKYVEGMEACVPYSGNVADILSCLEKGIRSGLSYSGAFNIEEFHQKAQFVQVTSSLTFENQNRGVVPF